MKLFKKKQKATEVANKDKISFMEITSFILTEEVGLMITFGGHHRVYENK